MQSDARDIQRPEAIDLTELLKAWKPHEGLTLPPVERSQLLGSHDVNVYIDNKWGAAVPYKPSPSKRPDGSKNSGYIRLKSENPAVELIPEAEGWPELQGFLKTVNALSTPVESVGCEKGYFPLPDAGDATIELFSYCDLIFTDFGLNEDPKNLLRLAAVLGDSVKGCKKWWGWIDMRLQLLKGLPGTRVPWGLMLCISNAGRSEAEARKCWGVSIERLGGVIAGLSRDFPTRSA